MRNVLKMQKIGEKFLMMVMFMRMNSLCSIRVMMMFIISICCCNCCGMVNCVMISMKMKRLFIERLYFSVYLVMKLFVFCYLLILFSSIVNRSVSFMQNMIQSVDFLVDGMWGCSWMSSRLLIRMIVRMIIEVILNQRGIFKGVLYFL